MQSEDKTEFAVQRDSGAETWGYVISPLKSHEPPAAAGNDDDDDLPNIIICDITGGNVAAAPADDDDVDIPDSILWDLAGGNVVETDWSEDVVAALLQDMGAAGANGGLPDITLRDDDDDSGDPDNFEWMMASDGDAAGPVHWDRVESYDHETREDIVETSGPSGTDPGFMMKWEYHPPRG